MARTHAASGEVVKLQPLGDGLGEHRTTAILKFRQLELVHLVLPAGKALREHSAPGEITVLCIEGAIEFSARGATHPMHAGDLIHLAAGEPHALRALEDASALVTICLAAP